ncbi:MAG TPA: lytic transglycosylase domain-containing protein [Candidatus Baltobacteraceae bacterium]|jgi:type IV secretion system protein VirB1|nr:lytic transglycosylase domain-containing protein [Candidatus Baltobacteraceae bacterium]
MNPAITGFALAQLIRTCAPQIGERTMHAVVTVESGGHPYEIDDDTLHVSYAPRSRDEAIMWATYLLERGHNLDLGIAQVNSANLSGLGLSVSDAFDPCTNIRAGGRILSRSYASAVAHFGPGQYALRRALGAYNTGSIYAGGRYISKVLAAAGIYEGYSVDLPETGPVSASFVTHGRSSSDANFVQRGKTPQPSRAISPSEQHLLSAYFTAHPPPRYVPPPNPAAR